MDTPRTGVVSLDFAVRDLPCHLGVYAFSSNQHLTLNRFAAVPEHYADSV